LVTAIESTLNDPRLDPLTPVSLLTFGGAVTLYRGESKVGLKLLIHRMLSIHVGASTHFFAPRSLNRPLDRSMQSANLGAR